MKKLIEVTGNSATRDPHITKYKNRYYWCFAPDLASVHIAVADTLEGLKTAESKCVYTRGGPNKEVWAPELHIIDGKCYLYVAWTDGGPADRRMYVLENHSDDPTDPYVLHGKIAAKTDKWAIDGTVMEYRGACYFVWSGWEGDVDVSQNLYVAKMKNPYELEGDRVLISRPEYDWEKLGSGDGLPTVNEGAFAFNLGGEQYLAYSAAGSWCKDYCIAALKLVGEDPLNPDAWEKFPKPLLSCNEVVQGAGHCSMFLEDGRYHVFFHAWDKEEPNITWHTVSVWHAELTQTENGFVIE